MKNVSDGTRPIACSLSPGDLVERGDEWGALLTRSLVSAQPIASGVRLAVKPGAAAELARLVDLERSDLDDARLEPGGPMTTEDVALWTEAISKEESPMKPPG